MGTHSDQIAAFIKRTCREAGKAGIKLRLTAKPDGYEWEWSNGIKGFATVHERAVAVFMACEDLAMPAQSTTYSFTV